MITWAMDYDCMGYGLW